MEKFPVGSSEEVSKHEELPSSELEDVVEVILHDAVPALEEAEEVLEEITDDDIVSFSEQKRSIAGRLAEKSTVFAKRLVQIATVASIAFVAGKIEKMNAADARARSVTKESVQKAPEPHLTKFVNAEGMVEYDHIDDQTEHILNYLSGKEGLSEADKAFFIREQVVIEAARYNLELPKDFDSYSLGELRTYFFAHSQEFGFAEGDFKTEPDVDKLFLWILNRTAKADKFAFHPVIYEALWELEEETGAPKIRWTLKKDTRVEGVNANSAFYRPSQHTIYINPWEGIDHALSEFPHAKQYFVNPLETELMDAKDLSRSTIDLLIAQKTKDEAQLEEYDRTGIEKGIEAEAHQDIEPKMREDFEKKIRDSDPDLDWRSMK